MLTTTVSDLTTDLQHFLDLQLPFELLPTEVLSYNVAQAVINLVELFVGDLHGESRGLQRTQDSDRRIIGSH